MSDRISRLRTVAPALALSALAGLAMVGPVYGQSAEDPCGRGLSEIDFGDSSTEIVQIRSFAAGSGLAANGEGPVAPSDLCLVKLIVGPGNPGPADAPSTSSGIGIEIWLPARKSWNERYVGLGQGGYAGGEAYKSLEQSALGDSWFGRNATSLLEQGYAISLSDDGHSYGGGRDGSFALNPDGSRNWPLIADWAYRALHVTAERAKTVIEAYYGEPPEYSYWNGGSTGGREGLMLAQRYPHDYDGIIVAYPAINWPRFVTGIMWGQVVMQNDLGAPIAEDKLIAVNEAAIAACDSTLTGQPDGFITDPAACRYDPLRDPDILCLDEGGKNRSAACLTRTEAAAVNKIWYGPRIDGEMVPPDDDNGWSISLADGQLWYGYNRGSLLHNSPVSYDTGPAGLTPFTIGSDWLAIVMGDPAFTTPAFSNESGAGEDRWKEIGYTGNLSFASIMSKSLELFSSINGTDNPDLREFKAAGGKIIHWHGLADNQIPAAGSVHYYERVVEMMGGLDRTRDFYRFYLAPGMGHGVTGGPGVEPPVPGGIADNPIAPNNAMLPLLVDWVENGREPEEIVAVSDDSDNPHLTRPWCMYPDKLTFDGDDISDFGSYRCVAR